MFPSGMVTARAWTRVQDTVYHSQRPCAVVQYTVQLPEGCVPGQMFPIQFAADQFWAGQKAFQIEVVRRAGPSPSLNSAATSSVLTAS